VSWQARLQYAAQLATSQDTLFMTWLDSGRCRSKTDESFQVTGVNNGHRLEVTRRRSDDARKACNIALCKHVAAAAVTGRYFGAKTLDRIVTIWHHI